MSEDASVERLRAGLADEYRIELPPVSDGVGGTLAAHDLVLDRPVSIRYLSSDHASESDCRSFREQARLLATLDTPNILPVHRAGVVAGVLYAVTAPETGDALNHRLTRGPLPVLEAVQLAQDLLAALTRAHAAGVTFPSLGPANVLQRDGGAAICGFGLAVRVADSTSGASNPSHRPGSPGNPLPNRIAALPGRQHDVYAVALILYQALTGRPWAPDARSRWRGVPRRLRRALKGALKPVPEDRWADSASFRQELEAVDSSRWKGHQGGALSLVAVLAALVFIWLPRPTVPLGGETPTVAVLGFSRAGLGASDSLGKDLTDIVRIGLAGIPGLKFPSTRRILRGDTTEAGALWAVRGVMDRRGDTVVVSLTLRDSAGQPTNVPDIRGALGDLGSLGDTVVIKILEVVRPRGVSAGESGLEGVPLTAIKAYLQGEEEFAGDHWKASQESFESALEADSNFALARWRLANVKRWRREPYDNDLRTLYQRDRSRLRPLDRMLIEALLEPDLARRFDGLARAVSRYPDDAYTRLLYGEELFHRGPLVGRPLREAVDVMAAAIARDSALSLAYDHLVMAAIRDGRKADAAAAIRLRERAAIEPKPGDPDILPFLKLAYDERFRPWLGWTKLQVLRHQPARMEDVRKVARMGLPWLDLGKAQLALSNILLDHARTPEERGSALEGQGLALLAAGRPAAALRAIDSAAVQLGGPEAAMQRIEWRIVLSALGHPFPPSGREDIAIARLDSLSAGDSMAARSVWVAALGRLTAGDSLAVDQAVAHLDAMAAPGKDLALFLRALQEGERGRPRNALVISDSARVSFRQTHPPDPFAGVVFHLFRGDWALAAGDTAQAEREWIWYEGSDVDGWPAGVAQAGEIDGALGVFARLKRGRVLLARAPTLADSLEACRHLRRVTEHWADAEESMRALQQEARRLAARCRQ